jgi:glycosyltransferase involved in cell wall biosynthesis
LSYEKGLFDLIEAVEILKAEFNSAFAVSLIGENGLAGEAQRIKHTIAEKGLTEWFSILPPKFSEEKLDSFANADIYVLPSHHEGMPMTIIEAMASGLPVVATAVGGIPELVVSGKTGYLVPTSNPPELAKAIANLISDPSLGLQLGNAGRVHAKQHFDINDRSNDIAMFYRKILGRAQ